MDTFFEYEILNSDEEYIDDRTTQLNTNKSEKQRKRFQSDIYFKQDITPTLSTVMDKELPPKPKIQYKPRKTFTLKNKNIEHIDIETDMETFNQIYNDVFKIDGSELETAIVDYYEARKWPLVRIATSGMRAEFMEHEAYVPQIREITWENQAVIREKEIIAYIATHRENNVEQNARELGIKPEDIEAIADALRRTGKTPTQLNKPKRKRLRIPSKNQIQDMLNDAYKQKGYIAKSWKDFSSMLQKRYPIKEGDDVNKKTLLNKIQKEYGLRSMRPKRRPFKPTMKRHLQNQLVLAGYIFKQHMANKDVLYFDQTTFQYTSEETMLLGSTDYTPMVTLAKSAPFHMLAIYTIKGIYAIQFLTNSSNTEEASNFIEQVINKYKIEHSLNQVQILMDNAQYQSTSQFRSRVIAAGGLIIYSIRQTPWINIIEDFFLAIKSILKRTYGQDTTEYRQAVASAIYQASSIDTSWILRKFMNNLLLVIQEYRADIGLLEATTWTYIKHPNKIHKALNLTNQIKD